MSRATPGAWRYAEAVGLCWALGLALFTALSFVLYVAGVAMGIATIMAAALALGAVTCGGRTLWALRRADEPRGDSQSVIAILGLGMAATQVALAAWMTVRAPFGAWDAWSFWELKARMFTLGGPRPGYFRDALTLHTHPDYPLNVPLAAGALFRVPGNLGLVLGALVGPACLAALLLLVYAGLTRLYEAAVAALATGALSFVPDLSLQAASGNADAPVALYDGAAALYLLLWWRLRRPIDAVLMGLLAGGAAWTKKEGLPVAMLLLSAYVIVEAYRLSALHGDRGAGVRRIAGVALATVALPAPWLLFCRLAHPLGRDFLPLTPGVLLAHVDRLPHIAALFLLQMLDFANWSLLWIVLALLLMFAARRLSLQGYGLLLLLVGQLGIYALSFVFSDWQPYTAHVQTSLDRLLVQTLPLALLLLVETVSDVGLRTMRSRRGA